MTCSVCGKVWPARHLNCPIDGAVLGDRTIPQGPSAGADSVVVEELHVSGMVSVRSGLLPSSVPDGELFAGMLVGEYRIERKVGQGGMGTVYAALHPVLGKRAAIKVINDEMSRDENAIARFRREARAVAQLASPHIVDVFGFGQLPDGRSYYSMAYLVGESLRERLERGRIPLDDTLQIIDQVARGLEVAHAAGIVHRDLKPENIFLERGTAGVQVVKLLDFGLVKLANADDGIATTHAGLLFGTPIYIAPEQIRSAATVDPRADIYSLGCIAFELMLGRVPFVRKTVAELIAAHLEREAPAPRSLWPEMPIALDALLRAMLAKDPNRRPTLGHLQEVIERLRKSAFANLVPHVSLGSDEETAQLALSQPRDVLATPWLMPVVPAVSMPIVEDNLSKRTRRWGVVAALLVVVAIGGAIGAAVVASASAAESVVAVDAAIARVPTVEPLPPSAPAPPEPLVVPVPSAAHRVDVKPRGSNPVPQSTAATAQMPRETHVSVPVQSPAAGTAHAGSGGRNQTINPFVPKAASK